jgi:hypothetical protein
MLTKIKNKIMAKKSKKEEVVKEVSSVDKKIAKLKAVIKILEASK